MNKKISIILPVYNGADHVAGAIESIIAQSYQNWELIIVNDCSTDKTLEICAKFVRKDSRIKLFSNKKNLKLPASLNVGFSMAGGDYYTWTSDDNLYKKNALEMLVSALQQNPNAVMVYANYTNIDADGAILFEGILQEPEYIVTGNVCGACFLYTADIAKKVGEYDETLFLAEDYDYWLRIYAAGKIVHIPDNLYLYRRHAKSLTETRKNQIDAQTYKALEKNFFNLYTSAIKHNLQNQFFDHMIHRAGESMRNAVKEKIKIISPAYAKYCHKKEIKNKIKATFLWQEIRKIKNKI